MVARVLCPSGMLFPLGANLLPYGSPIPKDGADVRANFIVAIKLLGSTRNLLVLLDTNPYLTRSLGFGGPFNFCDNAHCILAPFVRLITLDHPANVELVFLAEPQFRFGGSRFAVNQARFFVRAITDIHPGEDFRLDGGFSALLAATPSEVADLQSVSGGAQSFSDGLSDFFPGLVVFRREVVETAVSEGAQSGEPSGGGEMVSDSRVAAASTAALTDGGVPQSPAVIGDSVEAGSPQGSAAGDMSIQGGCSRPPSPVFYETGGDPETPAAHLITGGADGSHSDAGGVGEDGTDGGTDAAGAEASARRSRNQVLTRDSFCVPPAGFIRSDRMTNWPALWEALWATIGDRCPSVAELQSLKTYRKREEECYKQFFAKLAKEAQMLQGRLQRSLRLWLYPK